MSRLTAATIVAVVCIAAAFGADLWLDHDTAKNWGQVATLLLFVWGFCLAFPGDDR